MSDAGLRLVASPPGETSAGHDSPARETGGETSAEATGRRSHPIVAAIRGAIDFRAASSVQGNITANLASKVFSVLVALACVPVFIRQLGIGGYGLIGIWATLETVANLLDLGLTPTMTREMALLAAPGAEKQEARDLVRTLELIYWALALLIGGAVLIAAPVIATRWIRSGELSAAETRTAIALIGVLIACRWPLTFYAGGLVGLERQVLLAWATTGASVITNLGAVAILLWVSPTVTAFFMWQIGANVAQTVVLTVLLWRCMPGGTRPRIRPGLIRGIGRFAGGTTGIALVSMVLTDLDKIVVSKRFSLEIFGYYALAWKIAGVFSLASASIFRAVFPALCRLARGEREALASFYHRACQLMSVLTMPAATVIVLFGRQITFAWTGNAALAARVYPMAALLAAGTVLNALATVPFALQLAYGWTALAFYSNLASIVVTVPLLLVFTSRFGPAGAAAVWLLINFSYLLTQIPLTHRRLLSGEQRKWYLIDAGLPLAACAVAGLLIFALIPVAGDRFVSLVSVVFAFGLLTLAAGVATPETRARLVGLVLRGRMAVAAEL